MTRRTLVALLLLSATAGCQPSASLLSSPQPGSATQVRQAAPAIHGQIDASERSTQATPAEIASGATLSLIDATTGQTLATTLSGADGAFQLKLPGVTPVAGRPYYLEAVKGLSAGGAPNRIGGVAARLRTVLFLQGGDWVSLNSPTPGVPVVLSQATTAAAIIGAVRGLSLNSLIGTVQVGGIPFTPNGSAISVAEFNTVYGLVDQAVRGDRDPVEGVGYDPTGATPAAQYGLKPSELQLNVSNPLSATQGSTVTIAGQNLPAPRSDTLVYVGEQAVSWTVNAARTQMVLSIPANGYGGWVRVVQGASSWAGPFVKVSGTVATYVGIFAGMAFPVTTDQQGPSVSLGGGPMAVDAAGNLYIAAVDTAGVNGTIVRIAPNGAATTLGSGSPLVMGISGLAVDTAGNLYGAARQDHRIVRITPTGVVSIFAGSATATPGAADGPGASATFNQPCDVAIDANGNLYVADLVNNKIRLVTPAGVVSTLAGSGASGTADGAAASATFVSPYGLAVDGAGAVYVGSWGNYAVRKIAAGAVTTLAGSGVAGFQDGTGAGATFRAGKGMAVDASGNVYFADAQNNAIRKITAGGVVTTLLGGPPPTPEAGFRNGSAAQSLLNYCHHIAIGPGNTLYIGDGINGRTRIYTP